MKETEITVEVFNTLEEIKSILREKNYEIIREYNLNDLYYSRYSIEELKSMSYAEMLNSSILLRDVMTDNPKSQLVYKDKVLDENENVISEEKYVCKIDNTNDASKVLSKAGLTCWSDLRQRMFVYSKGQVEFAVQLIDNLGIFIEYEEDETMSNMNENEKINFMLNHLRDTGLTIGKDYSCKKVYMKFKKDYALA